ncbi:MAG TPA: DUF1583 domain-containing protein [Thermoguttaceae bacterium]|nr:DUF1583 domain-containing protein [Thermoguttaceae bacterium]
MNCGIIVAVLLASAGQMEEEFYEDFRGGSEINPVLNLFGPNATQVAGSESQGLRITLSANRPDKAAVGVSPRFAISGDFEITVGYEILSADEPPSGVGAGVGIWGQIRSDPPQAMSVACLERPEKGSAFVTQFAHERTPDGKRDFKQKLLAGGAGKKGRLRLARTGSELSFLVAEGEGDTFEELHRVSVRPDDVKPLRITASTNNAACGLSVRLVDLRIRADQLPGAAKPAETGGWGVWLVAFLLIIAVGVTGGFLLWLYRPWEQRGRSGSRQ